jgi:hypothetical protein
MDVRVTEMSRISEMSDEKIVPIFNFFNDS